MILDRVDCIAHVFILVVHKFLVENFGQILILYSIISCVRVRLLFLLLWHGRRMMIEGHYVITLSHVKRARIRLRGWFFILILKTMIPINGIPLNKLSSLFNISFFFIPSNSKKYKRTSDALIKLSILLWGETYRVGEWRSQSIFIWNNP